MNNKSPLSGLSRLLEIAGEKRGLLVVASLLCALSAVALLVPFYSVYRIISELTAKRSDLRMLDAMAMTRWAVIAFTSMLAGIFIYFAGLMCSHLAAFNILYGLRMAMSRHLALLPMGYFTGNASGAVKKTLEFNIEKVELFVAHNLPDIVAGITAPVVIFACMFSVNPPLAAMALLPLALGALVQARGYGGAARQAAYREYHDRMEDLNQSALEYVRGMPIIKMFGQTVRSFKDFHRTILAYQECAMGITKSMMKPWNLYSTIVGSTATFVFPAGVMLLAGRPWNMELALTLFLFMLLVPGIGAPLYKLMALGGNLNQIAEGVRRLDLVLSENPLPEPENPKLPDRYDITFERVRFAYVPGVMAIDDVSFACPQGGITALVGPSGGGKSTLAKLASRFWDVNAGAVRIGGVDVRDIGSQELFGLVSFVFQDAFLLSDSVYNNILAGKPAAAKGEAETAAKAARCHDFILSLPDGYDTKIGEGGAKLSGGEAQRIAVARAILKNSPILILDEATAFMDAENEELMQEAISELVKGKTVLVIGHRLPSVSKAGNIVVVKQGKIHESGTHVELLAKRGLYAVMWGAYHDAGNWVLRGADFSGSESRRGVREGQSR
ncbi:MAG: ABC transporter ATP-binding protein/permease [Planctomycetota bacterium]|nr:ABC transporter ATP-binding protein/permease [Planctomycetota bacterium]